MADYVDLKSWSEQYAGHTYASYGQTIYIKTGNYLVGNVYSTSSTVSFELDGITSTEFSGSPKNNNHGLIWGPATHDGLFTIPTSVAFCGCLATALPVSFSTVHLSSYDYSQKTFYTDMSLNSNCTYLFFRKL